MQPHPRVEPGGHDVDQRVAAHEIEADVGVLREERWHDGRDEPLGAALVGVDPQRAARCAPHVIELLERAVEVVQHGGEPGRELGAALGDRHAAGGAMEQAHAEASLERAERVAERRGRGAQLRRPSDLDDLVERSADRSRLWVSALDVTDVAAVRRVVDEAFAALGRIDVVVNNAGYGLFGAAEEVTDEQIRRQIDTNVVGSIQVIRAALPHLRAQRGGRILQVSSEGGQIAYPGFGLYHTSKWAIEGFCETLAQEVAPFGITVTIIEPGPTRTKFGSGLQQAPTMAVYDDTPVGAMRDLSAFRINGDPAKMARAMIDVAGRSPAPLRLALGSSTYGTIRVSLTRRLAELEAEKAITLAMDVDE